MPLGTQHCEQNASPGAPIKVILVDDHAVVRAGFRMLLALEDDIEVVAEAATQLYLERRPDVIVMDLSMPGIGGLESIRRILARDGQAKILVFSVYNESVYAKRALAAGALGYISKNGAPSILVEAIKRIAAGESYVESGLLAINSETSGEIDYKNLLECLTDKEFDVFLLLAKGLTPHRIAEELCLSYKTVANYSTQIRNKLQVSTGAELVHIAMIAGVLQR